MNDKSKWSNKFHIEELSNNLLIFLKFKSKVLELKIDDRMPYEYGQRYDGRVYIAGEDNFLRSFLYFLRKNS
jgi:hypothetical protein